MNKRVLIGLLGCILSVCFIHVPVSSGRNAFCSAVVHAAATFPVPDPIVFVRAREPNEGAFSLLIPKGWQTMGGIYHVDPTTPNGFTNSVAPKGNFLVKKDEAGTVMLHWLPDYWCCDTRLSPAGQMGLFPQGSYYNGMLVMPCPSAADFLLRLVLPQLRPDAANVRVVRVEALQDVAGAYQRQAALPGIQYDAARVTVGYEQGGMAYKEYLSCVIENLGPSGAGMWQNRQTVCARAPFDEFAAWEKVGAMIYDSVRFDPHWLEAAARATRQRTQNAQATQRYIQGVGRQIVEHRQNTNAEIRHGGYLLVTGQDDYINPHTGETEIRPDGWKHHWQNSAGEVVVSNARDYDPNHDDGLGLVKDFKESRLRPR